MQRSDSRRRPCHAAVLPVTLDLRGKSRYGQEKSNAEDWKSRKSKDQRHERYGTHAQRGGPRAGRLLLRVITSSFAAADPGKLPVAAGLRRYA